MTEDKSPYARLISRVDPVMAIVTTAAEGVQAGCLVGFHSQSSIEPEQHCVWLSKANHTYRVALRASHLAVHLARADDPDLAERFGATTGDDVDKFDGLEVTRGPGGVPLLAALPHRLVGRRIAVLDVGGDHAAFCLAVEEADSPGDVDPLHLAAVEPLDPGHDAQERAIPPETGS